MIGRQRSVEREECAERGAWREGSVETEECGERGVWSWRGMEILEQ